MGRERPNHLRSVAGKARPIAGKLPPHDLAAERIVLGACILSPEHFERVRNALEAEDFYAEQHEKIYAAMVAIASEGVPIDPTGLRRRLEQSGDLARIGGPSYIGELMNEPDSLHAVTHHAALVAELAVMRRLAWAMQEAEADLYHHPGACNQLWRDKVVHRIGAMAMSRTGAGTVSMRDAAKAMASKIGAMVPGKMIGLSTGFENLDAETGGFIEPQIYLVGGATGGGKSAFAHCVAMNVAGWAPDARGVAIFSAEMLAHEVGARCACARARVDWKKIATGGAEPSDLTRYYSALEEVGALPIAIDEDSALTPMKVRSRLRQMQAAFAKQGRKLCLAIVDYVQLMGPDAETRGDNRERELSEIGNSLKLTAELFDIPIMVLTQLNEGKPRDCKALEYHAQNFWIVEHFKRKRPMVPGVAELPSDARIRIVKGRFVGDGSASTYFHKKYTLFTDEAV